MKTLSDIGLLQKIGGNPSAERVAQGIKDDAAIDKFAEAMKRKMAKKRAEGRGGWDDPDECGVEHLAELLIEHLRKGDPIDIANFSMMLFHREGGSSALREAAKGIGRLSPL